MTGEENKSTGEKEKFTVSFVFADKPQEYNTSNWRMVIPAKALAAAGYGVSLIPIQLFQENTKECVDTINNSHVVVVERNYIGDVLTQMAYWKVRARTIILNWDDAYHCIEESNISYPYWKDGTITVVEKEEDKEVEKKLHIFPHPFDQFIWGLKMGHAATLPSKQLMRHYEPYIPTYYVPNYFETKNYIDIPKTERDFITIGWGGSVSHVQSFRESGVLEAIKNIVNVRPNVKIMICGDKRNYDLLEIPEDRKIFQEYIPYEQWGKLLAESFDIGIAPLAGDYDNYRSWIKPVEYCLTQTPWIASSGPAYNDLEQYGKLISNTQENWTDALLFTVDNLEQEKEKCKNEPYKFGLSTDVNVNVENIADTYRTIARVHGKINLK